MNITLYKAAEELRDTLENIDPETGELPDGFENAQALVQRKAMSVAAYILDTDAQAEMVEAHAKTLLERVKTARKRSAWLRQYLRTNMQETGITKVTSEDGTFTLSLERDRDESVDVFDEAQLPAELVKTEVKTSPDKVAIKKLLKDGQDVPGARIVKKDRLSIR